LSNARHFSRRSAKKFLNSWLLC